MHMHTLTDDDVALAIISQVHFTQVYHGCDSSKHDCLHLIWEPQIANGSDEGVEALVRIVGRDVLQRRPLLRACMCAGA